MGDTSGVETGIQSLRSVAQPADRPQEVAKARACAEVLETWLAVELEAEHALESLERLDVTLRNSPRLLSGRAEALNFATARLWERLGYPDQALAAIRQRHEGLFHGYRAAMLREEGRLAALVGDRDGAIAAYLQYLELLSHPEPTLTEEVAQVRDELAQLGIDPPGG